MKVQHGFSLLNSVKYPTTTGAPLLGHDAPENKKFPVAIYCHGLSGMRTTYSTFCQDLASHGIVVAAIEHRDGSACVAGVNGHADEIR